MRKTKRFTYILLAIMLFYSCLLFCSCKLSDETAPGSYYLTKMSYMEDDNTTVTINMNILLNKLTGYCMKLVLSEDGTAKMVEETDGVEVVSTGSWIELENGDIEMLFSEQTTIAKRNGKSLTVVDNDVTMVFKKLLFEF